MIKLTDSRGKSSHTLGFVALAFMAGTIVFLMAAIKGEYYIAEYGVFFSANLAPYLFREYKEKANVSN